MASSRFVKVEGFKELDRNLGELRKATAKSVLVRAGKQALQPVAERMIALAPDDPETSGHDLKSNIGVGTKLSDRQAREARGAERSLVEVHVGVGPSTPQGYLQEFGTPTNKPQPFARPAWEGGKDGVLASLVRLIGGELEKTVRRLRARGRL